MLADPYADPYGATFASPYGPAGVGGPYQPAVAYDPFGAAGGYAAPPVYVQEPAGSPYHQPLPEAPMFDEGPPREFVNEDLPYGRTRDNQSTVSDTWTLALSDITYNPHGGPIPLNLMEELMLLKAGDKPKFHRRNLTLDRIMAAALLLELVVEQKVSTDGEFAQNPRNLVLRVIDDSPTGSNIANSALKAMKKRELSMPMTTSLVLSKIAGSSGGLAQKVLWRLVKKKKLVYDPRTFGADKYPVVGGAQDLDNLRERVVRVMDRAYDIPDIRDQLLAFLYYLPKNAADRIFQGMTGPDTDEIYTICKSIGAAVGDYKQQQSTWI